MTKILAVEIGFGDVKVVGDGIKFKFPTVIAYSGNGVLRGWNEEEKSYSFSGRKYLVGNSALSHPEMFSSRDPVYLFEFAPLFLYKAFELAGYRPDRVALGLAVGYYSKKDSLSRKILSFEVNGERVEIPEPVVFPQAVGIWFDWADKNPDKVYGNYMVLDIGFNTVDVVFIKGGKVYREGSWMLEGEGTIKIVNHLADVIQQKVGVGLIPHTAKTLLERKSLMVYGKERNLERAIAKLSLDYTERLFSILTQRFGEKFRDLDRVIVGGGGAYYVKDSIPKKLKNLVKVIEEPEFSNARGFYKALKEKEESNETYNHNTQQAVRRDYKETETES